MRTCPDLTWANGPSHNNRAVAGMGTIIAQPPPLSTPLGQRGWLFYFLYSELVRDQFGCAGVATDPKYFLAFTITDFFLKEKADAIPPAK